MEVLTIIIIVLLIIILYVITRKTENYTEHYTADEAIQNISSLYNSQNMIVTNLQVTNNLNPTNFKGIIVAYSGALETIPNGWAPCNGKKYKLDGAGKAIEATDGLHTPDLRSRFIYGYNENDTDIKDASGTVLRPKLNLYDVGGEEYHTLTINEMPSHTHKYRGIRDGGNASYSHQWDSGNGNHDDTPARDTSNTGNTKPHNNMPPYIVLLYIMKL